MFDPVRNLVCSQLLIPFGSSHLISPSVSPAEFMLDVKFNSQKVSLSTYYIYNLLEMCLEFSDF